MWSQELMFVFFLVPLHGVISSDIMIRVDPPIILGLVHNTLYCTISSTSDLDTSQIYWEPSVPYITSVVEGGKTSPPYHVPFGKNSTIYFKSSLIGIFHLRFYTVERKLERKYFNQSNDVQVLVARSQVTQNILTNIGMGLGLGFALLIMGLDIDLDKVLATVKRPVGPLVGFFSQFLAMPLLSYLLGYLVLQTNYERLGLLLLGCCPGGVGSNFWTAMLGGDINLSVTMTFFSSIAAFAMTSFWIWTLGTPLVDSTVPIPFGQLTISLLMFAFPLGIGVWIRKLRPEKAKTFKNKVGKPLWLLILLALIIGGVATNIFFFYLVTWRHMLAGACLGFCGYMIGGGLALIMQMERPQVIAIAIETAVQNGGIAIIVLNLTFPSPYSDMALLPILAFFFVSTGPFLLLLYGVKEIRAKFYLTSVSDRKPNESQNREQNVSQDINKNISNDLEKNKETSTFLNSSSNQDSELSVLK